MTSPSVIALSPGVASPYRTLGEIAEALGRPISTVRHWAAGSGRSFPSVIRLPNRNVIVHVADVRGWDWTDRRTDGAAAEAWLTASAPIGLRQASASGTGVDAERHGGGAGRFFTIAELAVFLRQSPHTVGRWSGRGGTEFPKAIRLPNRTILIERGAAERWLHERRS